MRIPTRLVATVSALALSIGIARAQTSFGSSCAGASGVTPELAVSGVVQSGQQWTLEVTAPGGLGLGYLLVGLSNTSASALGGVPLPLDLGTHFARPQWAGCLLSVDPQLVLPYTFDPNANGGVWTRDFPGFDSGTVFLQVLNIDPDFVTRIAGVSTGLGVVPLTSASPISGMASIPAGTFQMGSNAPSGAPYFPGADETVHTVTISQLFWMGEHEVTQAEYEALMGSNPAFYLGVTRPVERVSWFDAEAYCQALTAQESTLGNVPAGYEYRLPTEAEWEYTCRGGTTTEFNVGAEFFCSDAWFSFSQHSGSSCSNPSGTLDVGSYAPNAWGLFDMHGNVWEWCLDSFASYSAGPVTDPFVTGGSNRVFRGGGWNVDSSGCRSAVRSNASPGVTNASFGFRVVLAPALVPVLAP